MDYYLSPRFRDKLAIHITKNYLDLPGVRVPLILGIHGRKGEGKTFQCELTFERMGIEVVHISGGELESPDAGDPARLLRLRYREAAELVRVRGKMAVVMINDLDAGAGRFDAGTQYTVNTQLVNATLMNIADNPTNVQLPGSYDENPIRRVPIIVTGNDFSTLYAPLVRDGRMEKFYWQPDHSDRLGIVGGIFAPDGLPDGPIRELLERFSDQSIDFFGALRARVYDEEVRHFINTVGIERISMRVVNSTQGPPQIPTPRMTLKRLMKLGQAMEDEQRRVREGQLAEAYNRVLQSPDQSFDQTLRQPFNQQTQPQGAPAVGSPQAGGNSPSTNRPAGGPYETNGHRNAVDSPVNATIGSAAAVADGFSDVAQQVRELLAQGYCVGIEHVDRRRFQTNAWQSFSAASRNERQTIAALADCLMHHPEHYVRLIGVEPGAKRRVAETIVQRPSRR